MNNGEYQFNATPHTKIVIEDKPSASPKSKTTALLLCFLLGTIGAHRFYVGKVGSGIVWLFTFGCFGFGVLIDFIKLLSNTFNDQNGLPLIK